MSEKNKDMEADINSAIEKHLSKQVGELLQAKLKKADEDASMVEFLRKEREKALNENEELKAKLEEHSDIDEKRRLLASELDTVERLKREQRIFELETKLSSKDQNEQFLRDVAMGLVRNVEYRSSVFKNDSVSSYDSMSSTNTTTSTSSTTTTDKTAE